MSAREPASLRVLGMVFTACALLLAANIGAAFLPLGRSHAIVSIGLAATEAVLLGTWWMELRRSGVLLRIAALLPLAWLTLLIVLIALDDATRVHLPLF